MEPGPASSATAPRFAVVVPMYNEQEGAENCVRRVQEAIGPFGQRAALIAVNDGSADSTGAILAKLVPLYPQLQVVTHPQNQGYGAALRSGAARAAAEDFQYALFMDSDLTNDPADIPKFVAKMDAGYDVIKATRYSDGGRVQGVPFRRVLISRVGNLIARLLFRLPVRDCTNGYRAVKTSLLAQMRLTENRFPVIMEELYYCKHLAHSFANVPVTLTNRSAALRSTSFRYRPGIFWAYLKYPLKSLLPFRPAAAQ